MKNLICWHDNEFVELSNVKISPLDFGFIHSDATYDVLRSKKGRLMHLDKHIERFSSSCDFFGFDNINSIESIAKKLLDLNSLADAFVWMCCWRGAPPINKGPRSLKIAQHQLVYVKPYYNLSPKESISLYIHTRHRRVPDTTFDQSFKNFSWTELTIAQREAIQKGFDSGIVLSQDGFISEGAGFSVCFIRDGEIVTPKRDCLKSVTVSVVEEICFKNNIKFSRSDISIKEAMSCHEVFACSTSGGVTLVNQMNDRKLTSDISVKIKSWYDNL